KTSTPTMVLPTFDVPVASAPTRLPCIKQFRPRTSTPTGLPEMTLPAPAAAPPTVLVSDWIVTPLLPLPRACVPVRSVPIRLPSIRLFGDAGPIATPATETGPRLAEIRLRAAGVVPPMVFPDDDTTRMPSK